MEGTYYGLSLIYIYIYGYGYGYIWICTHCLTYHGVGGQVEEEGVQPILDGLVQEHEGDTNHTEAKEWRIMRRRAGNRCEDVSNCRNGDDIPWPGGRLGSSARVVYGRTPSPHAKNPFYMIITWLCMNLQ
jgi:hypothetical protein